MPGLASWRLLWAVIEPPNEDDGAGSRPTQSGIAQRLARTSLRYRYEVV